MSTIKKFYFWEEKATPQNIPHTLDDLCVCVCLKSQMGTSIFLLEIRFFYLKIPIFLYQAYLLRYFDVSRFKNTLHVYFWVINTCKISRCDNQQWFWPFFPKMLEDVSSSKKCLGSVVLDTTELKQSNVYLERRKDLVFMDFS